MFRRHCLTACHSPLPTRWVRFPALLSPGPKNPNQLCAWQSLAGLGGPWSIERAGRSIVNHLMPESSEYQCQGNSPRHCGLEAAVQRLRNRATFVRFPLCFERERLSLYPASLGNKICITLRSLSIQLGRQERGGARQYSLDRS